MKKTFRTLLIICFSIISCSVSTNSSDRKNDLFKYGFNGKVKSMKSELFNLIPEKDTFKIGDKENGIGIDKNLVLEFNQLGNLILSKEFLANGDIRKETTYTYDKRDRLLKLRETDHYGKGSFLEYNYNYDSQDSITQLIITENDFKRTYKIERDDNNRPIKSKVIQNDTVFATYILKYDQSGNLIVQNEFEKNDIPKRLFEITFNKENLKEKEHVVEYNAWDTLNYENRFFYDKNQNLALEKYKIENDTTFIEIRNTYHKNGKLKESITTPKGIDLFVIRTQKFNKNGDLIENVVKSSDGITDDIWEYKFKYDSANNWIEKVEYKDKKPFRILKRTIEYYK